MMTAPLRFVGGVLAAWVGVRVAMTLAGGVEAGGAAATAVVRRAETAVAVRPGPVATTRVLALPAAQKARGSTLTVRPVVARAESPVQQQPFADLPVPIADAPGPIVQAEATESMAPIPDVVETVTASRWSGDAYVFLRRAGAAGLAPGAQLGGGQAFARLSYRLDEAGRLAATVRVSRALGVRQSEGAVGVRGAIAPGVTMTVERRIALDAGGRSAWAAFVAAGVDGRTIGPVVVDGYAQAGVVGARRRDGFVDGAMRVGMQADAVRLGAGIWGAAQPGAARLDVGPQAVMRGPAGLSLAVDWRVRVAGEARPGSGVAVTLAAGF